MAIPPVATKSTIRNLLMAGFEALELVNIGLVLTNASGQLLLANRTAENILAAHDGLVLDPNGVLCSGQDRSPIFGNPCVRAVTTTRPAENRGVVLAILRPSGQRPLTLLIRPVQQKFPSRNSTGPAALVFVLDPEFSVHTADAEMRQLYGLTSAETRLANLLMEGKTIDDCCSQLGVRRTTVRMHLRHLFVKTGVQRQSELVSVLFKSLGLIRSMPGGRRNAKSGAQWPEKAAEELSLSATRVLGELVTDLKLV